MDPLMPTIGLGEGATMPNKRFLTPLYNWERPSWQSRRCQYRQEANMSGTTGFRHHIKTVGEAIGYLIMLTRNANNEFIASSLYLINNRNT